MAKTRQKFVKSTVHADACNSLTYFEQVVVAITGTRNSEYWIEKLGN
jgi:hypothetical protein